MSASFKGAVTDDAFQKLGRADKAKAIAARTAYKAAEKERIEAEKKAAQGSVPHASSDRGSGTLDLGGGDGLSGSQRKSSIMGAPPSTAKSRTSIRDNLDTDTETDDDEDEDDDRGGRKGRAMFANSVKDADQDSLLEFFEVATLMASKHQAVNPGQVQAETSDLFIDAPIIAMQECIVALGFAISKKSIGVKDMRSIMKKLKRVTQSLAGKGGNYTGFLILGCILHSVISQPDFEMRNGILALYKPILDAKLGVGGIANLNVVDMPESTSDEKKKKSARSKTKAAMAGFTIDDRMITLANRLEEMQVPSTTRNNLVKLAAYVKGK